MKKVTAIINKHSQVTIPASVRQVLIVKPGDKVTFTIEDRIVRLARAAFTLESAYGSVKPSRRPEDFEKISRMAKDDKAKKSV